jgi:hypothetical protein
MDLIVNKQLMLCQAERLLFLLDGMQPTQLVSYGGVYGQGVLWLVIKQCRAGFEGEVQVTSDSVQQLCCGFGYEVHTAC